MVWMEVINPFINENDIKFTCALLLPDTEKYSWGENYAGSSGLQSPLPHPPGWPGGTIDQLEMDRCDQQLTFFPLLACPEEYVPDTVDLTKDKEAR